MGRCNVAAFEDEGHDAWRWGDSKGWKQQENGFFPPESRKELDPADTLTVAH